MVEAERCNSLLNQLLIALHRSLLQYIGDAWPWVDTTDEAERTKLLSLVEAQRKHNERLIELLIDRGWSLDFGTYPTEYTDLHYVALSYLLKQLIASEQSLIGEIDRTLQGCAGDSEAVRLLERISAEQRRIVGELTSLGQARPLSKAV
jgi:hypothetical protein